MDKKKINELEERIKILEFNLHFAKEKQKQDLDDVLRALDIIAYTRKAIDYKILYSNDPFYNENLKNAQEKGYKLKKILNNQWEQIWVKDDDNNNNSPSN